MNGRVRLVGEEVAGEEVESSCDGFEILIDSCLSFGESGFQVGQTLLGRVWRDHIGATGVFWRKRHGRGEFGRSSQELVGGSGRRVNSKRRNLG